jgi:thymidylate synthase (FAD)
VSPEEQTRLEAEWFDRNVKSLESYEEDLAEGMAPEQARVNLPQSLMTSWTWSGTLGAFANMCKLRLSSDTQVETRVVAQAVYEELKKQFPVAAPLLVEGVI